MVKNTIQWISNTFSTHSFGWKSMDEGKNIYEKYIEATEAYKWHVVIEDYQL